jgi:hypothetical protein
MQANHSIQRLVDPTRLCSIKLDEGLVLNERSGISMNSECKELAC